MLQTVSRNLFLYTGHDLLIFPAFYNQIKKIMDGKTGLLPDILIEYLKCKNKIQLQIFKLYIPSGKNKLAFEV